MKKFKRIMALVIALAMVLGMTSMAAFADETTTTVTNPASKNSGEFTITMSSAEDGHTFKAYRIFDGSVATLDSKVKLGDISWATGVNLAARAVGDQALTMAEELEAAGVDTTIGEVPNQRTLDLSKAADVAEALALQADDSEVMIKVADIFYARKGSVVATVSEKTGENYVLGSGAAESANAPLVAGYYLVTDEYTNAANVPAGAETLSRNILEVVGDVQAAVKNDKPQVEKKILTPTAVDANNAGIGDTVAFQITGSVPNYVGYDNYFYVINDTLSTGLTFDGAQNVVVKVQDTTDPLTEGTDYVVLTSATTPAASTGHTFEIAFKNIKDFTVGKTITVTYTATVNENAAVGTPGNKNETDVTYSNNPNDSSKGNPSENPKPGTDTPTGTSAKDTTVTYVAELDLTKYKDEIGASNLLDGATFTLTGTSSIVKGKGSDIFVQDDTYGTYWKLSDGTYTTTAPHGDIKDADNNVKVASNESSYDNTTKKYKLQHVTEYEAGTEQIFMSGTSTDGKITFKGLGEGTYTLTEVVTPSGYNTADPITFTIEITEPTTINDGTESATFAVTDVTPAGSVTLKNADNEGKATTGIYETNVVDKSGTTLPSTGGIGTTIFYVVGAILVIGAGVILITRRRMDA